MHLLKTDQDIATIDTQPLHGRIGVEFFSHDSLF